jgi:NAD-dependent deacetylase
MDAAATLARWIGEARRIVGFTGAGVSTESGVPDFRSPQSPWLTHPPMPYQEFVASPSNRREAWRRKFIMDDLYKGARPSAGHHFLAGLVSTGRMPAVITQNIDGLHQASGIPPGKVIELHGNGTYALCLDCGKRHELAYVRGVFEQSGDPPACTACGGIVKSGTISFGQAMPAEPMQRARDASEACDLFIAMGSSLVVYPAAGFPILAKRRGARLVIINRERTDLDTLADLVIHGEIGATVRRVQEVAV